LDFVRDHTFQKPNSEGFSTSAMLFALMTQTSTEKPTTAFVLSLIGGIIIFLSGLAFIAIGNAFSSFMVGTGTSGLTTSQVTAAVEEFGAVGAVFGIIVIFSGVMLYIKPERHVIWGVLVIVFSVISFYGALGGFVIGFILGLIGGILGIVWHPKNVYPMSPPGPPSYSMPTSYSSPSQQSGMKTCASCGASVPGGATFCANCGKPV
jgi:Family of unknown function (DUF6114)/zinc-ribbon domain